MRKPNFTTLHISMMCHYYASPEPYARFEERHRKSQSVTKFRRDLWNWGLIMPTKIINGSEIVVDQDRAAAFTMDASLVSFDHDGTYIATDRGRALVEMWQTAPLPTLHTH